MDVQPSTVVCVLALLAVALFVLLKYGKKEHYTRTPITAKAGARDIRSPVDYINDPEEYPHFIADPSNKLQPLDQGPVDFYPDLRRLNDGTLGAEYSNMFVGGTGQPFIPNDTKTRINMKELGAMGVARELDNAPFPGHATAPLTELTLAKHLEASNPFKNHVPITGGPGFFRYDSAPFF